MNAMNRDFAVKLLCDLVAIPSVNPMGAPTGVNAPVERAVIEYLERLLAPYGLAMRRQSCGPSHENLLIELPGRDRSAGATLMESHLDTVGGDAWADRAWTPRVDGDRVLGLGSCDDKASLTAMLMAMLDLLESRRRPPQAVWLLAAGDEEYGMRGIRRFLEDAAATPGRGVFGEPTELVPVIQHKGAARWEITTHGRAAHTSRPELGENAILKMTEVIAALRAHEADLRRRHHSGLLTGPTLTVAMIRGGQAYNVVPDVCTAWLDYRFCPPARPEAARQEVVDLLARLDASITHSPLELMSPPLVTSPEDPLVIGVLDLCRQVLGRPVQPRGVPYATDAAWMPPGCPAIVLGPGSIESAHAVDEWVDLAQVVAGADIYRRIMLRDWR
jgi:acetylornithine deacetylase